MISFMISLLPVAVAQCRPVKIRSQCLWGLWPTLTYTRRQCNGFNPRRPPHYSPIYINDLQQNIAQKCCYDQFMISFIYLATPV